VVSLSHEARPTWAGAGTPFLALAGSLLAAALAFLYAPLWSTCWQEWWADESYYSHGILIPPLALLMIWYRRDALALLPVRPAASGLVLALPGLALALFGRWAHSTTLSWISFLLLVIGGIAFATGWRVAGRLLPPVLFLTFMVPLSAMLTQPIVFSAQMISTRLADGFLQMVGFETQRFGVIIQMEDFTLQVGVPCSGFKTLIALSSFAACFIYLLHGSLIRKMILFAAAIVLSLLANGVRIGIVGVTGELISDSTASWVHDNGGLPVTALALGGLFLMAQLLKCPMKTEDAEPGTRGAGGSRAPAERVADAETDNDFASPSPCHRVPASPRPVPSLPRRVALMAALFGVAAFFAAGMPTVQSESLTDTRGPAPLALRLGSWEGVDQDVPPDVQQGLPSAKILSRRYQSGAGAADVTIITGSDATALHDPHDCLTGEGWQFLSEQTRELETGGSGPSAGPGGRIRIRDVVMVKGPVRARMWYWYRIGPEVFDRTLPARLALFRTRIAEKRRHRAEFVRLIVGGEADGSRPSASTRTTMMLSDLARHIAGREHLGADLPPESGA
jgi:EpsI family protein